MRFHVVNVAQSNTTKAFPLCGFSRKTINFCWLLKDLGHTVYLYGGEENEAVCDEFIPCIDKAGQTNLCMGFKPYILPDWSPKHPVWQKYNRKVADEINKRKQKGDFVCILGGNAHMDLPPMVQGLKVVEYGIGYTGHFSNFRVWESHTWRAFCLGRDDKNSESPSAKDTVINAFYDSDEYQQGESGGYVLFLGRVTASKGVQDACAAAKAAGRRLLVAGYGDRKLVTSGAEYLGAVEHAKKLELLAGADWLICPTRTLEPFGNVSPEAQLCGVPVISTNWGGFTETVNHGLTGWRCETVDQMARALNSPVMLNKRQIRENAIAKWSRAAYPKWQYQDYFTRLSTF